MAATKQVNGVPLTRMRDLDIDPSLFDPMSTGNDVVDDLISNRGGVLPSTVIMVTGDPGAGKTTMLCDWMAGLTHTGHKTLFISSEMDHIDFADYTDRFPQFGDFDVYFVDYERDIKSDIENLIQMGWDAILIDSFKDLKDKIAEQENSTKTSAELFLVNQLKKAKGGIEVDGQMYHTATIFIQQVLKSGGFAGSNTLKHLVTASAKLVVDGEESYIYFDKNRRGETRKRLYYEINDDVLEYDVDRMERQEEAFDFMEDEKERQSDQQDFASINDLVTEIEEKEMEEELELVEEVRSVMEDVNRNLSAALREVKKRGLFDENFTRYKLEKFVDNHGIQRRTYN